MEFRCLVGFLISIHECIQNDFNVDRRSWHISENTSFSETKATAEEHKVELDRKANKSGRLFIVIRFTPQSEYSWMLLRKPKQTTLWIN